MTEKHKAFAAPAIVMLLAALLLVGSVSVLAGCSKVETEPQTEAPSTMQPDPTALVSSGRATFEASCARCHGPAGKGNGEVTGELVTLPADITQLTLTNDGTFPADAVMSAIDGRKEVEAHGPREMPIWGDVWSGEAGSAASQEVIEQRINELVEYIRSIQE